MRNNKILGNEGEEIAIDYLINSGYKILDRNFRCKTGEIDIIIEDNEIIAFVEVKTRSTNQFGNPSEAVGYGKQRKIVRTALMFIMKNKLSDRMSRFDVLEIIKSDNLSQSYINHIKDAFTYSGKYGY